MILDLTNPHSVLAALKHRPQDVLEVRLSGGKPTDAWSRVAEAAMDRGVAVTESAAPEREVRTTSSDGPPQAGRRGGGRPTGSRESGPRGIRKGGRPGAGKRDPKASRSSSTGGRSGRFVARVRALDGVEPEELFAHVRDPGHQPGRPPGLWLALDCVQDPHNLGAVFRSAAFFGVRGVLLTRDRSAPLSAVVYDVASGGMESVPYASPPNLDRALKTARDAGLWILGAAEEAKRDVSEVPRDRPWLLVLGNEESGLRRLTRENCDDLCRITSQGEVGSLNISAAGAVLMANLTMTGHGAASGEAAG